MEPVPPIRAFCGCRGGISSDQHIFGTWTPLCPLGVFSPLALVAVCSSSSLLHCSKPKRLSGPVFHQDGQLMDRMCRRILLGGFFAAPPEFHPRVVDVVSWVMSLLRIVHGLCPGLAATQVCCHFLQVIRGLERLWCGVSTVVGKSRSSHSRCSDISPPDSCVLCLVLDVDQQELPYWKAVGGGGCPCNYNGSFVPEWNQFHLQFHPI